MSTARSASINEYVAHGWYLVELRPADKRPVRAEWNARAVCERTNHEVAFAERVAAGQASVGLALAFSGLVAIDIDDIGRARVWLADHGVDLDALMRAPDAVRRESGRPNRTLLLYRSDAPLRTRKVAEAGIEFLCATAQGLTTQIAIPPSINPKSQQPYHWVGDWRQPVELPAALRAAWESVGSSDVDPGRRATPPDSKSGIVGAVCRSYDPREEFPHSALPPPIYKAMCENFAPGIGDRYCYRKAASGRADGIAILPDGALQIFDATFPGGGVGSMNILDLMRLALWDHLDSDSDREKPANERPSYRQLVEALRDESRVREDLERQAALEQAERLKDFEALGPDDTVIKSVPPAQHLCTDQANAQRIMEHFGGKLMSSAGGVFYAWSGTHWKPDDGEARRIACNLSAIVAQEAKEARAKAEAAWKALDPGLAQAAAEHPRKSALGKTPAGQRALELVAVAESLDAWSRRCEAKSTQDAALGMLRELIQVPSDKLDANERLLSCESGTVDLRTGELKPHDPQDFITKYCPVRYDPSARAPRFEAFVAEIMGGDGTCATFLQRWFGYCATGSMREQKFVVHIGPGANGKGTLLTAISDVLGGYAGTASIGLFTAKNGDERHTTEIAELLGRRMVTAHEPDDCSELREGLIKQLTGADPITARFMRRDNFTFQPTCKIQLLTNHKPEIRGTDFGIWRRVLLVPYPTRFGSADQIAAGNADRLRDESLADTLRAEREGIYTWLVSGAVEWYRAGLAPPDAVLAAGHGYQMEQDRVSQFVEDCCQRARDAWTPITDGNVGLYATYDDWCKQSGYRPLGKNKFLAELERAIPLCRREDRTASSGKTRRTVRGMRGVKLLNTPDFDELAPTDARRDRAADADAKQSQAGSVDDGAWLDADGSVEPTGSESIEIPCSNRDQAQQVEPFVRGMDTERELGGRGTRTIRVKNLTPEEAASLTEQCRQIGVTARIMSTPT